MPSARAATASTRAALAGDASTLARIARAALPEAWTETSLRAALERPGTLGFATEPIHGFVLGWRSDEEAEILTLAVEKEFRGQGHGRALVAVLLEAFRGAGVRRVTLEVRRSNAPALALYRAAGFSEAGVRTRYYRDGEDALVLGAAF